MNKTLGLTLALLATFCWASAIVLSKAALADMDSHQLFFIQIVAAAAVAIAVIAFRREKFTLNKKSLSAYATGLLEPFLAYMLSLYGLMFVSASMASVIFSTETIIIIILSLVLLKNKIAAPFATLGLITLAGFGSYLALYPRSEVLAAANNFGYAFIFAGVFFAALYVVLSAKLIARYSPTILLGGQLSFCTILFTIFVLPFVAFQPLNLATFFIAALSGILQYYIAFCCYLLSLKRIKIHTAGAMLYFIPVFSIALAAIFLGEQITRLQLIGVAIIVISLLYLNTKYARADSLSKKSP